MAGSTRCERIPNVKTHHHTRITSGGARFGRLEALTLGAACRVRKIFTLRECPPESPADGGVEASVLAMPRTLELPPGTPAMSQLFTMGLVLSTPATVRTRAAS